MQEDHRNHHLAHPIIFGRAIPGNLDGKGISIQKERMDEPVRQMSTLSTGTGR